jgi:hypothetical protein
VAAKKLVEMLIGVCWRTGHLPSLCDVDLQTLIRGSAPDGLIGLGVARCARCGLQAPLIDWVTLGMMSVETHRQAIVQAASEQSLPLYGYLLQCKPAYRTRQPAPAGGQGG